jgi:hypothetical protein
VVGGPTPLNNFGSRTALAEFERLAGEVEAGMITSS